MLVRDKKHSATWTLAIAAAVVVAGLALPTMAARTSSIGVTSLVVRQVEGKTEEEIRQLALKDSVYQNEIVQTGIESASELRFADETRISVGPNSTIVLDEFVYDPDPGEGSFALQVTEGVFRFFSGNMDHSNYKIETPTVTVGVRGTVLVLVTRGDGAVAVIMESDDGVEVYNKNGEMGLIETPGSAIVTFADGQMTPPGSPPAWALWRVHEMDDVLQTAGLPPVPPIEPPDIPEPPAQVAAAPPPPPPPPPPPEPVEEPGPVEEDPMRGQPRATEASGKTPSGQPNANEMAQLPDPPGHDTDTSGASTSSGGSGNGNGNGGANGNGNGNGNANGHSGK